MLKAIKTKINNFIKEKDNNNGFSFVVIVIILLVTAFTALTVTAIATDNYNMKVNKSEATDVYYNAESGLNAVKACLEDICAARMNEAYGYVQSRFSELPPGDVMNNEFQAKYIELLYSYLIDKYTITEFDNKNYISEYENIKVDYDMIEKDTDNNEIIIRDVIVTYDNGQYRDEIVTDICCKAPRPYDDSFKENTLKEKYAEYSLIVDNQLSVTKDASIKGNVYTGNDIAVGYDGKTSLSLESDKILTRKNIVIYPQSSIKTTSYTGEKGEIFASNLITLKERERYNERMSPIPYSSDNYNAINMKADVYIANDTLLGAKNGNVAIDGKYYGYKNNKSSIGINSPNINVDLTKLNTLWLAGTNYINTPNEKDNKVDESMMGESLTSKLTQSMYLVPSDCIYTTVDGKKKILENPIDTSKYSLDEIKVDLTLSNSDIDISKYANGYKAVKANFTYDTSANGTVKTTRTYLYLTFNNTEKAIEFSKAVSSEYSDYLLDRAKSFNLGNINISDGCILKTKGTVLKYDNNEVKLATASIPVTNADYSYTSTEIGTRYNNLCNSLTENESLITDSLFGNIIDETELIKASTLSGISDSIIIAPKPIIYKKVLDKYDLLIADCDVSIIGDYTGVIITTGNINIENNVNFTGTIICKKDLNIRFASTFNKSTALDEILEVDKDTRKYFNEFKEDPNEMVNAVKIPDYVVYRNWSRY